MSIRCNTLISSNWGKRSAQVKTSTVPCPVYPHSPQKRDFSRSFKMIMILTLLLLSLLRVEGNCAIPYNTMQYHAIACNTMQYHAIPCNTRQYNAIPCNTMQYHPIPCIIINCWRSVPLPCGQYKAIFSLVHLCCGFPLNIFISFIKEYTQLGGPSTLTEICPKPF